MALVKFKRNWFGPDGKTYSGLSEVGNDMIYPNRQIPSDAVVMSDDGTLPSDAVPIKAGFGAKPEYEQVLDQIPFAAPLHMRTVAGTEAPGTGIHPPRSPGPIATGESTLEAAQDAHNEAVDRNAKRVEEARAKVTEGVAAAKEMATLQAEASGDPSRMREAEGIQVPSGGTADNAKKDEDFSRANELADKQAKIDAAESNRLLAEKPKVEPALAAEPKKAEAKPTPPKKL